MIKSKLLKVVLLPMCFFSLCVGVGYSAFYFASGNTSDSVNTQIEVEDYVELGDLSIMSSTTGSAEKPDLGYIKIVFDQDNIALTGQYKVTYSNDKYYETLQFLYEIHVHDYLNQYVNVENHTEISSTYIENEQTYNVYDGTFAENGTDFSSTQLSFTYISDFAFSYKENHVLDSINKYKDYIEFLNDQAFPLIKIKFKVISNG